MKILISQLRNCFLPGLFIFLLIAGCSQFSDKSVSVGYHNLTARYNAYYIAKLKLEEAEYNIAHDHKEDYNQLLPLILPWDSVRAMPVKAELEDVIKKASVVAERHQNSKWLDNSYILLGRARLHLGQWNDGTEALRYVFSNGRDDNDKNEALTWLMQAYVERDDFTNALNVAEYLKQQPLPKEITKQYYLTKAFLHQQKGEYLLSVAILEELLPLTDKSPEKARLHYIAGQLYDKIGQFQLANDHYIAVGKNHPLYDLAFYAEMGSLQNRVLLNPETDISSVGFERMLKDRKNTDLKDRLYYTMGLLEESKGNYKEALSLLSQSVMVGRANTGQVPYTYLQLARIHYDRLDDYTSAKLYYDSALVALPKDIDLYKEVSDRKIALDNFVKYFEIIRTEDSLQILAALNPIALDQKIDQIIEAEIAAEKKKKEEEERKLAEAQKQAGAGAVPVTSVGGTTARRWELYDPALVNDGKSAFRRTWGNRELGDDWRRAQKDLRVAGNMTGNAEGDSTVSVSAGSTPEELTPDSEQWKQRHALLRANVPVDPEVLKVSHKKKEDAMFELGKIYRFALEEKQKAEELFRELLNQYPQSAYKEEIYYLNYLAAEGTDRELWKNKLVAEFPGSTYVSLLGDSDSGPMTVDKISGLYAEAFALYEKGDYEKGLANIEGLLPRVRQTQLEDKFALLRIFLIGKVRGEVAYKNAIQEFLKLYPKSEYESRVREMSAMQRFR